MGNRLTDAENTDTWTYNQNNELETRSNTSYEYDNNGNTVKKTLNGATTLFFYNLEDRLERVEDESGNITAKYDYDPFGRRLWKETSGTRTYFMYADEGLIGEYTATGTETKTYGWKPGSTWGTDPLFMKIGSQYYFYHNDHLGTPQKMTSISGAVVWSATYSSFGKAEVDADSTVENNFRLPGQYFDGETGLHLNYYRYYNSSIALYQRIDPKLSISPEKKKNLFSFNDQLFIPMNHHRYVYSQNNPLSKFDPLGLDTLFKCKRPLDALGGKGSRSGPDIFFNPFYHEYFCVEINGKLICSGQTAKTMWDIIYGEGRATTPNEDNMSKGECEVAGINKCLVRCILKKLQNLNRPNYGLIGPGTNCKEWNKDIFKDCMDSCF